MANIVFWTACGLMTGWTIAIIQKQTGLRQTGTLVGMGAIGGVGGGLLGTNLEAPNLALETNPADMLFVVFGAVLLAGLGGLVANKLSGRS